METRNVHLQNLRNLTPEELDAKVTETKKDLFTLRFQLVSGRIENPANIKAKRRDIARMKTIAREKALAAEKGTART
jgi:large subunit ribosomal protein L29